jgi:hypothetical protein
MGLCDLCGQKAGWFQERHPECGTRAEKTKSSLRQLILEGVAKGKFYTELETDVAQTAAEARISVAHFRQTILQAVNDGATQIALKTAVPENELSRLVTILQGFGIDADATEWVDRKWFGLGIVGMSHTIWQVLNDVTPYYDGAGRMQFNLRPGELPVFSAGAVTYAEERTVSGNSRTYNSLSVPIGGGMYYHMGNSQSHQASGLLPVDVGEMFISTRALYFGGQQQTLRIPLERVIRYQLYMDAVGVCESHGAPKVFIPNFRGMDTGWFFFNLLSILTSELTQ